MAAPAVEKKIYTGVGLDFETGGLDPVRCACTQIALEAIRLDTLEVFDCYTAYIAPYCKQELGAARRKVLRSKHELAQPTERMDYEPRALEYSGITMERLEAQGASPNGRRSARAHSASRYSSARISPSTSAFLRS